MPKILRDEIENPLFKDSGLQIEVLNKIVNMLGVNFFDEDERKISAAEWVNFVSDYKLTAPEILEAYKMALKQELQNNRNETIRLFPNLSLISAGEVLQAFQEFKKNSKLYEQGQNQLKLELNPVKVETEEEKNIRIENTIERIKEKLKNGSEISEAFILFNDLFNSGQLKDFLFDKEKIKELQQEKMQKLITKEMQKPFFYNKKEIQDLKKLIEEKKLLPVHNIVNIDIKNEIVIEFVKSKIK